MSETKRIKFGGTLLIDGKCADCGAALAAGAQSWWRTLFTVRASGACELLCARCAGCPGGPTIEQALAYAAELEATITFERSRHVSASPVVHRLLGFDPGDVPPVPAAAIECPLAGTGMCETR